MPRTLTIRRAGMTLVELLVVITILGLLAVTVLPSLATSAELRRTRETTRMVSSFISKAQSRAISRQEWSGLKVIAVNPSSAVAIDLFLVDVPDAYRGDTSDAKLNFSSVPNGPNAIGTASPSDGALESIVIAGVSGGDPIRFDGRGTLYEVISPISTSSIQFRLHENNYGHQDMGQTLHNMPWPALSGTSPSGAPLYTHTFAIHRQPQTLGIPLTLLGGRAVDLFWSGLGPWQTDNVNAYQKFSTLGGMNATSILFDSTGRLRQVICGTDRYPVSGPVFLLIGRADRVAPVDNSTALSLSDDASGANWQYPDSYWIAIDPLTGIVRSAECNPGATTVLESQRWIRQALLAGGT